MLDLSSDLPMVVEIVDQQEKIDRFVELADKMIEEAECGAMITIEKAEVIRYKSRSNYPRKLRRSGKKLHRSSLRILRDSIQEIQFLYRGHQYR
jgi:hypothetical protein